MPVVYHTRKPRREVSYRHYPNLVEMARAVDILHGRSCRAAPATANMINAEVLDALGPDGILINMARGSVVDEPALIKALKDKRIMAAGLDVFAKEPEVPAELIAMENVVLFPHLGSASVYTREQDGSACRRQHCRLGRRQAAADAGRGNAVAVLGKASRGRFLPGN